MADTNPTPKLCECGCGQHTALAKRNNTAFRHVKGQPVRFIQGHTNKNKPVVRPTAYRKIGAACEHVLIAEMALGRPLPKGAEVHHVDGNSLHNANRNLVICESRGYHMLLHARARIVKAGGNPNTQKLCSACKKVFDFSAFTLRVSNKSNGRGQNCLACRQAFNRTYKRPVERTV
jgi:hypothetical protein